MIPIQMRGVTCETLRAGSVSLLSTALPAEPKRRIGRRLRAFVYCTAKKKMKFPPCRAIGYDL
ncbi:MAG: hypothetical protein QOJ86_113 [Bradyrhizobium sp.]|jgi:hypothetical protein|nr:hypothetical protein [Bradyrhizobium sp.]